MATEEDQPPQSIWRVLLREHNFNIDKAWQAWLRMKQRIT